MGGSVAEVLLGEEQQGFAIHLERRTGDRPQGELLLSPSEPLRHILPAPKHWLQTWRGMYMGEDRGRRWKQLKPGFGKEEEKLMWCGKEGRKEG